MTDLHTPERDPARAGHQERPTRATGLFRAAWRWHFFVSFLVAPVLLLLAVTGLIYLFRFQVEPLMHADVMRVEVPTDAQAAATTKT